MDEVYLGREEGQVLTIEISPRLLSSIIWSVKVRWKSLSESWGVSGLNRIELLTCFITTARRDDHNIFFSRPYAVDVHHVFCQFECHARSFQQFFKNLCN